jgi:hypothetical protein
MAEFQWWLLIAGLVTGGAVVALLTMDTARRDEDVPDDELTAEATFIAAHLAAAGRAVDGETVALVLQAHRAYLELPPPDALVPAEQAAGLDAPPGPRSAGDGDPDGQPDDVGHGRGAGADRDLPPA